MKITKLEHLHADAGQRNFDFLKISTDDGLVGWSEYNESFGGLGVSAVIDGLASQVIGKDPTAYEALVTLMYAVRRQAAGGVVQQAIGAIENALLDIKAKALGIPVYTLLGGPVRDTIRLYWSHCGTYRIAWAEQMQIPALRTLQDVVNAGKEVRERTAIPVASCECLFGRRDFRPFFENGSVDVAIIDTPWNGVAESLKIASMADAYEINVAPHNFYGHLATMMSAHFCAVVPNLRIMEIDPDTVPWYDELVTVKPDIRDGHLHLPTGPGWGTEVNEAGVRAHPPRKR